MVPEKVTLENIEITPVDPHSPIPLYYQVHADLKEILLSGGLQPGDMLPPEVALSKAYAVGRQTVRQAIARLVDENLVERYAGRGTFVREPADRTQFYLDRSFTQQMAEMGLHAHSKVLRSSTGVIDENAPAPLRKKLGCPCLNLVRLRYGDNLPIGVQSTVIITESCPDLEQRDFNLESLYHVLSTEYKLAIVEISHVVSAVTASDLHADLLQTSPGAPLLVVKTTAYLEQGEPIEATTSYYRADKYEFSITNSYRECE